MNSDLASRIFCHLKEQQSAMVQTLSHWASIESPSEDPEAQQPMFAALSEAVQPLHYRCQHFAGRTSGGQWLAIPAKLAATSEKQLILGHCDTVWAHGTLEAMPIHSQDGCLYGPGVYDMKAGLVQAVFALQTLSELGLEPQVQPILFVNSDEEIGSSDSAPRIQLLAKAVDRVFVMEPSLGIEGRIKTTRKGVSRFAITVHGRSAHAGLDPEKGVSAVLEVAHVIQKLFAMNDPQRGITVNVGTVQGGTRPNVIAHEASAQVDVRVQTQADADKITRTIEHLQPTLDEAALTVETMIARPPLEATPANRKLWQRAQQAARHLHSAGHMSSPLLEGAAGGGSDGNWTSLYTATLDGMGAVGEGAHAHHEHVVEDEMPRRAALLACVLLEPTLQQRTDGDWKVSWERALGQGE